MHRTIRQLLLVAVALAASALVAAGSAAATEGPWCALTNVGYEMRWDCSMQTLEMCRQEVIAGNRGFCNPNPRWQGSSYGGGEGRPRRKRYRD
jgi:Protein of unknown function (DUF3551)